MAITQFPGVKCDSPDCGKQINIGDTIVESFGGTLDGIYGTGKDAYTEVTISSVDKSRQFHPGCFKALVAPKT